MITFGDFLKEMAVGKIAYGDLATKALGSDKLNDKFEKVLERHAGFNFNFKFMNMIGSEANPYGHNNAGQAKIIEDQLSKEGYKIPGHITVVITYGTDEKEKISTSKGQTITAMPLTPWIRIHRACHGFIGDQKGGRHGKEQNLSYKLMEDCFHRHPAKSFEPKRVFMFASVHDNESGVSSFVIELYRDVLTEYIWHGGEIRVNPQAQGHYDDFITDLKAVCHQILTLYVGKVVIENLDF